MVLDGDDTSLFGFLLVNELRKQNPSGNVLFSPLSISNAFRLVYLGAEGLTRTEMKSVFGLQDPVSGLLKAKGTDFEETDNFPNSAKRVFINNGFNVKGPYRKAIMDSNFQYVNFADTQASQADINSWVETVTLGLIPDSIPDGFITSLTQMVLVNAIHPKGIWDNAFRLDQTRPGKFRGFPKPTTVDFMQSANLQLRTKSISEFNSRVIELPYEGDQYSMFIILPEADDGFTQVEKGLANFGTSLFTGLSTANFGVVKVPKWKFDHTLDALKEFLQALGLRAAFTDQANLSEISTAQLMVSDVGHRTKIFVDEKGTEAAAATEISTKPIFRAADTEIGKEPIFQAADTEIGREPSFASLAGEEQLLFEADHPFVYFIVNKNDNTVLFQGTITSP